jgi:ABC-type multidrug transport system ATPase subunit/ABC-type transporter Mla maintaining outer membrane lipid asymmetry permease subunit MlaE
MSFEPPALRLESFSLAAGGKTLLTNANLVVSRGELVLLAGASGSGKSTTTALLLGLSRGDKGVESSGIVLVDGGDPRLTGPVQGVGVVFQDFALFDDWDAATNVAFARDHGRGGGPSVDALLDAFKLPSREKPGRLSGGQKRRLAVARALAAAPKIVFYDEPTSGLDPALAVETGRRIKEAHARGGMTSIVVTHDLAALAPIADRVVLLDPFEKTFRDVAPKALDAALETLRAFRAPEPQPSRRPAFSLLAATNAFFDRVGGAALALLEGVAALVPRFPRPSWGLRFLRFYAGLLVFGPALPFVAFAGAVTGFVVSFFLFELIPYAGFTEPVLLEEIVAALGFTLARVAVPGTVALLFAARGAAAAAADFGRRAESRQSDALKTFGVDPKRYLLTSALLASLLGTPVLLAAATACASFAAGVVFLATHELHGAAAFDAHVDRLLDGGALFSRHVGWALGKTLVCVFGAVVVAWNARRRTQEDGALAKSVTRAVVGAILWTLLVQLVFAFVEFDAG